MNSRFQLYDYLKWFGLNFKVQWSLVSVFISEQVVIICSWLRLIGPWLSQMINLCCCCLLICSWLLLFTQSWGNK